MFVSLPRKALFDLPDGVIYLDGNSLGPLPLCVPEALSRVAGQEWAGQLIRGWNSAGWMAQPARIGNLIAPLIGAAPDTVMLGDTLSIKVFQALSAALGLRPERRTILSDTGNFPTDLYMAQGLMALKDAGYQLRTVAPEAVAGAIDTDCAAVMLTEVDYRTGRIHNMDGITRAAHAAGAVMIWDLAHSAGAIEVDLTAAQCEFAVGCTYKYLNGGPGAPAFIYVRPDLIDRIEPSLSGWLGHDAPFAFEPEYRPAAGMERLRVGTPPVLQMAALEAALSVWQGVSMADVRAASIELSELFIREAEDRIPDLELISPRDPQARGSQVSFGFAHGYAAMQALIARGVIGDFRAPDVMRFGFCPLYLDADDILQAVGILAEVVNDRLWDDPRYKVTQRVT